MKARSIGPKCKVTVQKVSSRLQSTNFSIYVQHVIKMSTPFKVQPNLALHPVMMSAIVSYTATLNPQGRRRCRSTPIRMSYRAMCFAMQMFWWRSIKNTEAQRSKVGRWLGWCGGEKRPRTDEIGWSRPRGQARAQILDGQRSEVLLAPRSFVARGVVLAGASETGTVCACR